MPSSTRLAKISIKATRISAKDSASLANENIFKRCSCVGLSVVSIRTSFSKMFPNFNIHFFMRKHKPGVLGGVPLGEGVGRARLGRGGGFPLL